MGTEQADGPGAGRTVVERPPPGLARGKIAAPAWAVTALGLAIVLGGLAYLLRRWRRGARR